MASDAEITVAPCPRCRRYTVVVELITTSVGDGPVALALDCGHEVRFAFFEREAPFDFCGAFPDDPDLVTEAMYDG